ncbi:hypothetical protein [Mesorhizobium sp.]|nr:hypothetical protein [Mesorhizobium sp.]
MKMRLSTAAAGFLLLAGIGAAAAQDVVIEPERGLCTGPKFDADGAWGVF